jgi:hypothetical protein
MPETQGPEDILKELRTLIEAAEAVRKQELEMDKPYRELDDMRAAKRRRIE